MIRIATHTEPVRRPLPGFMLRVHVDDVGGGTNCEQLWTRRVGEDLFELCCIPFFAYGMALDDVVRADPGYVVHSVVKPSGHGVVRVAVVQPEDEEAIHATLHDLIGRLEYVHEWFAPGYVAIDLAPATSHERLHTGLAALGHAVEIEWFDPLQV